MAEPALQAPRLRSLDVLRAIAVLLVLGRHLNAFQAYHDGGWTGVSLFFVLSGFLISGLLFTDFKIHGHIRIARFLIRRGFKIYPPFYVLIGWTMAMWFLHRGHLRGHDWVGEVFFLQSYLPAMWGHTWSLAVEEHFYLVLPLLLVLLCRISSQRENPFQSLPWIFLSVAGVSLAYRIHLCAGGPTTLSQIYYPSHMNVDALFFGVLLSYCHHFRPAIFGRLLRIPLWILLPATVWLIAPCFFLELDNSWYIQTLGHPALYLGFGGILLFALSVQDLPPGISTLQRLGNGLALIGRHSYSIYLWHGPVADWGLALLGLAGLLPAGRSAQFAVYAVASLALGIGMSRLVEIPTLKLRDRLFPSLTGSLAENRADAPDGLPLSSAVTEAG